MMLEGSTLINYLLINLWRHHNSKICVENRIKLKYKRFKRERSRLFLLL